MEHIVRQAQTHGFNEGWLAALQTIGIAEDSPLRNPEQIPYPAPVPPVYGQVDAADEEETLSMRKLVHAIDTHVEMVDLEVTSNLHAEEGEGQMPIADQPAKTVPFHQVVEVTRVQPIEPSI